MRSYLFLLLFVKRQDSIVVFPPPRRPPPRASDEGVVNFVLPFSLFFEIPLKGCFPHDLEVFFIFLLLLIFFNFLNPQGVKRIEAM